MALWFCLSREPPEGGGELTLPISSEANGAVAANHFDGWTSPACEVFSGGALSGVKKLNAAEADGRIAAKTTQLWRDAEVTTYGQAFYTLLRLTAAGKAFAFEYSGNVFNGLLAIYEVSGINQSQPINLNGTNGTVVREIYNSSTGGATMTSRFGASGTDVVANFTTTYASGHEFTFGASGIGLYVDFKGIRIIDLPYDAWTHMEAGRIALAPATAYGVIDSSVDFLTLVSTESDFSDANAPILQMADFGLKEIRQTGSISASSTTLTVPDTSVWEVGDQGVVETGQVTFTITPDGGNAGNGAFVPGTPYLSTDDDLLDTWATGNWVIEFISESTLNANGIVTSPGEYTVTRPDASDGGSGFAEQRYNDGITFQIMEGGTPTLVDGVVTFPDRVPFAIGDTFTIACAASGETSTSTFDSKVAAGRNRTMGVGGSRPEQSITTAQRLAPTNLGYSADTLAYVSDNVDGKQGLTYYVGPSGASYSTLSGTNNYYFNKLRPMSLKFTVVAVLSPTTLQIDTAASATTANATVWVDSHPVFQRVLAAPFAYRDNVSVRVPAGDYALSEVLTCDGRTGWQLKGAGMDVTNFYQPRGVDGSFLGFSDWEDGGDEAICDFTVWGNDHPNGGWAREDLANHNALNTNLPNFMSILTSLNSSLNRVKIVNSRGPSLSIATGRSSSISNCVSLKTVPSLNYSGWMINISDSPDADLPCNITDCTMTNSWLQGALETFQNDNVVLSGFTMTNGVLSTNTSSDYTISDGTMRFTRNSQFNTQFSIGTQALSVSSNQGHTATTGGRISNVDFLYDGYLNEDDDIHVTLSIELSPSPGVIMDGTYNPLVADDGIRRGLISRPDWAVGTNSSHSPAIVVAGPDSELTVTNYRFVGAAGESFEQIWNQGAVITADNNVRDTGPAGVGTNNETGNVTNPDYNALGASGMPDGADGIWYADQANTSAARQYIPNELSAVAVPTWVNKWPKPRTDWALNNVSQTTGVAGSFGGHDALRLQGTGAGWYARDDAFINFKAAQYTLVVIGKTNFGSAQTAKLNFGFTAGTGTTVTFNTTLTRVKHTATQAAGLDNPFLLSSSGGDADITIDRWFVYEGTDPFPLDPEGEEFGGHLLLGGTYAYTQVPTVASNEVDISASNKFGQIIFDSYRSLASFTAFATVRKVGATSATANTIYSGWTSGVGDIGLAADYENGQGFFFRDFTAIGYRQAYIPGTPILLELLDQGYNVLVWKYDASNDTGSFWINDVLIAGEIIDKSAMSDFHGLLFNDPNEPSSVKWNSGAFYPTALSRADIESAVTTLKAKAVANSLTLDTMGNFIFFEGDSNTDGAAMDAPGDDGWPYVYAADAAEPFYGSMFAQNGGALAQMVARAPILNAAIPTVPGGRKFILVGMIGTNDASTAFTSDSATYLANLLAYWGAAKAAGWTTIGMPILPRTDVNVAISPVSMDTWRGVINAGLLAAVGDELDACLDPADVPLLFANGASDNTTYFKTDKVHLTVTGQATLAAAMGPIIDAFL